MRKCIRCGHEMKENCAIKVEGAGYSRILADLEQQYSNVTEPLRICGLSLGALLALDFAIRHGDKVASLVLIGAQYKVPTFLIDFQNILFRCMPGKSFDGMGLSKSDTIKLSHSMRSLDFTSQLNGLTCPVTIVCGEKDSANLRQHRTIAEASAVESPIRQETIGFPAHFFARAHNFKPPGRACQPEADSPMRT